MWMNVDFLFIDEYSMIGCSMLYNIHNALSIAKESSKPFGGINIIFAGDFCQLPTVGETRLYANFSKRRGGRNEKTNLQSVYGKLLWLSIKNVVFLENVERQRGANADVLIALLARLREGKCTSADYDLLSSRVATRLAKSQNVSEWQKAPIIVRENTSKDALNVAATEAFARQTGRHLFWYYSTDKSNGEVVCEPDLKHYLQRLPSSATNHRLGWIPLVIGMPVMIMTNFDVEHGVVNGQTSILKSVQYWINHDGLRHATSCIVESDRIVGEVLPGLEKKQAVALEDKVKMSFIHPHSKKKMHNQTHPDSDTTCIFCHSLQVPRVIVAESGR